MSEYRLRLIEKYIAETLVLSQDKLAGTQRFAIGVSSKEFLKPIGLVGMILFICFWSPTAHAHFTPRTCVDLVLISTVQHFRILLLRFTRKRNDADKLVVDASGSLYAVRVNQRAFEGQDFDQRKLDLGKPLAEEWTIDVPP